MSSNEYNEKENEDEDETMSQNKKVKDLNDILDEIIDQPRSFEEQIKSLKEWEDVKRRRPFDDFGEKELKSNYFKIELADMSNEIDEKLFKQIFGHTLQTLANKLINTINKEENQTIVNNIKKNEEKFCEECETSYGPDWVIQQNSERIDVLDAIKLILNFNQTIQLDSFQNIKIKKWVCDFNWGKQSKIIKHFM